MPVRRTLVLLSAVALSLVGFTANATAARPHKRKPVTLHLGYFPNVTHAPAIVGVEAGLFKKALGKNKLETSTFNAGGEAVTALFADALDASYIGPSPTINAWAKSNRTAVKIVSGAASGGAFFVVKPGIKKAKDLKGKKVASPQLGNTQDVSLRAWLKSKGLKTDTTGGGDVSIVPQDNALTLQAFQQNTISGAWVPEPWATRLVNEGGGKILVDEATLWPEGQYVTTQLVVSTRFLDAHPDVVKQLVAGQVAANDYIKNQPAQATKLVAQGIKKTTGKKIALDLVDASFKSITFTNDPIASSLQKQLDDAVAAGLVDDVDLKGIYNLRILNKILKAKGEPAVT